MGRKSLQACNVHIKGKIAIAYLQGFVAGFRKLYVVSLNNLLPVNLTDRAGRKQKQKCGQKKTGPVCHLFLFKMAGDHRAGVQQCLVHEQQHPEYKMYQCHVTYVSSFISR
jgi:hypothetical protein